MALAGDASPSPAASTASNAIRRFMISPCLHGSSRTSRRGAFYPRPSPSTHDVAATGRSPSEQAGELEDAVRREVLLADARPERCERVLDGVGERRRRTDRATFAHATEGHRVIGIALVVDDLDVRHVVRRREEVRAERVAE